MFGYSAGICNLYSVTTNQEAIRRLFAVLRDMTGNLPPLPGIFPDYMAPVVHNAPDGVRELAMLRWGMPSSQLAQLEAAKKRARKLEAKGKSVTFDELLRMSAGICAGAASAMSGAQISAKAWPVTRCVADDTRMAAKHAR